MYILINKIKVLFLFFCLSTLLACQTTNDPDILASNEELPWGHTSNAVKIKNELSETFYVVMCSFSLQYCYERANSLCPKGFKQTNSPTNSVAIIPNIYSPTGITSIDKHENFIIQCNT